MVLSVFALSVLGLGYLGSFGLRLLRLFISCLHVSCVKSRLLKVDSNRKDQIGSGFEAASELGLFSRFTRTNAMS